MTTPETQFLAAICFEQDNTQKINQWYEQSKNLSTTAKLLRSELPELLGKKFKEAPALFSGLWERADFDLVANFIINLPF